MVPEQPQSTPVPIRRRPLADRLRYLAGKLREDRDQRDAVSITLDAIADELRPADVVTNDSKPEGPEEIVTIPRHELTALLAVATLYADAFREDEKMTLPERMRLQEVEEILERRGKWY